MKKTIQNSTVFRGMTHDGSARILVADTKDMVNEMIRLFKTAPTATAAMGRALTAASMIGTLLPEPKNDITITFSGDGEIGKMIAVGDYFGNVKGYIQNPNADPARKPNGKLDVGKAIGQGMLSVVKDLGNKDLQTGMIQIKSGEIAEDIAAYFAESEQVPTLLSLGVLVNPDGTCKAAGGVLIQLLPFPDEATVCTIEKNADALSSVSSLLNEGKTLKEIADIALLGVPYDPFDTVPVHYACDCSRTRMKKKVLSLGKIQVAQLLDEQEKEGKPRELTAICRFCNKSYTFNEDDLLPKQSK